MLEGRTEIEIEIPVAGLRGVDPSRQPRRSSNCGSWSVKSSAPARCRTPRPVSASTSRSPASTFLRGHTIELSTSEPLVIATTDGEPDLGIAPVIDDGLRLVATGAVTLYERPDAAAAWFVPGLRPTKSTSTCMGLAPTASRSNFAPLRAGASTSRSTPMSPHDRRFPVRLPGLDSTVGGDSASIDEVDGLVTGAIEPGRHDVVLTYRPQRLGMLTLLTAAALIVLAVLWLTDRGQGRPASRQTSAAA